MRRREETGRERKKGRRRVHKVYKVYKVIMGCLGGSNLYRRTYTIQYFFELGWDGMGFKMREVLSVG